LSVVKNAAPERAAHPGRHRLGLRRQRLSHEERITTRPVIQLIKVDRRPVRQPQHRRPRQYGQLQARDRAADRQLAEHDPQRMRVIELIIAIAAEQQRLNSLHATRNEPDNVERRLVGPVQILEDQHRRRRRPKLTQQRDRNIMSAGAALDSGPQLPLGHPSHVEQRSKRPRREQRLTRRPQQSYRTTQLVAEPAKQRRLTDPRLSAHQHHAPPRSLADDSKLSREHRELPRAFQ
jgi:hypothetical protein